MHKFAAAFFTALIFFSNIPAYAEGAPEQISAKQLQEQQDKKKAADRGFFEKLKGMPPQERAEFLKQNRDERRGSHAAAMEEEAKKRLDAIRQRIMQDPTLTPEQKKDMLARLEEFHRSQETKRKKRQQETKAFMDGLFADKNLAPQQRQEKMREFLENQKAEMARERQETKTARKGLRAPKAPAPEV